MAQREQLLVEGFRDSAVYELTPEGHVASWNSGAERMHGYRAAKVIGEHFSRFYSAEDVRQGKPDRLLRIAAAEGRAEDEGWRLRKRGSPFWARVVITASRDDAGRLCGFVKVTRDLTELKQIGDALHRLRGQHDAEQRERLLGEERQLIACGLHEHVEQAFFAIGLTAAAAMGLASTSRAGQSPSGDICESLVDALSYVTQLSATGSEQLRAASVALNQAEVVGRGLVPALSKLVRDFGQRTGIEAELVLTGSEQRLQREVAETLYAVAREALVNVQHHSRAGAVLLGLHISPRNVTLCIQDDGSDASAAAYSGTHSGLRGIAERVLCLSGTFAAGPNPDGGFLVRTRLPLTLESA
jgi:PAS domain S-box-containing protein